MARQIVKIPNLYIGKQLKELSKNSGVTFKALSKNTKIPSTTISTLANNKVTPTENQLNKLCSFFNVDYSYFGLEDKQPKKELKDKQTQEAGESDINLSDVGYTPKLPEIPEMLATKGVRNIGCATLKQAYKDAKKLAYYKDAKEFVKNSWCVELCEVLDIDYASYKATVLEYAGVTEELDKIISLSCDFKECEKIINNIETMAKARCKKIGLKYEDYYNCVLENCKASNKLNANIEKAKNVEEWKDAFIFAGTNSCNVLCNKISISYELYKQRVINTCKKTSGENLKMKYETTEKLYKMLERFYLNDNRFGIAYIVNNNIRETLELFNLYTRNVVLFSVDDKKITISNYRKDCKYTTINHKEYRAINLYSKCIEVGNNKYYLY